MNDWIGLVVLVGIWVALQLWVLPRLGIRT
jgi:hypothetical protein